MHVSENDKVIIAPAFRISTMLLVKEGTITIEEAIARIKNAETEQVARPSSGLAITAPSNDYSGSVEGMVVPGASMLADTVPVPVADGVVGATPDGNGDGLVSPTTPSNTIVRSGSASSMQSTPSNTMSVASSLHMSRPSPILLHRYVVEDDYIANGVGELAAGVGDILSVEDISPDGNWIFATCKDNTGNLYVYLLCRPF